MVDSFPEKKFPRNRQIGWIAQDIEKYIPELVTVDDNGYLNIAYSHSAPIIAEAVVELSKDISKLTESACDCDKEQADLVQVKNELKIVTAELDEMKLQFTEIRKYIEKLME